MRISAFSSNLRSRAAHDAPPATPPTMMTFISSPFLLFFFGVVLCAEIFPYFGMVHFLNSRTKRFAGLRSRLKSLPAPLGFESNRFF
jgi:hypothetical protein